MAHSTHRSNLTRRISSAVKSLKALLLRKALCSAICESICSSARSPFRWMLGTNQLSRRSASGRGLKRATAKERSLKLARQHRRGQLRAEQLELRALMAADLGLESTQDRASMAAEIGAIVPGSLSVAPASMATEIVFVDPSVSDPQSLLRGRRTGVEFVLLDGSRDGISQIVAHLEGRSGLRAIHLVGHGRSGEVYLGTSVLGGDRLSGYSAQLARIGGALNGDGDILVYGCETADGAKGEQFLRELARLTSADVAGSTDITGAASQGGDWILERTVGVIDSTVFATPELVSSYQGTFVTISGTTSFTAPLNTAVNLTGFTFGSTVNPTANNQKLVEIIPLGSAVGWTDNTFVGTVPSGSSITSQRGTGGDAGKLLIETNSSGGTTSWPNVASLFAATPTGGWVNPRLPPHATAGVYQYTLRAYDPGTANTPVDVTLTLTVGNTAPVLTPTNPSLGTVSEDAAAPSGAVGASVSSLVGGITDTDVANGRGIAITSVNANGTLHYSLNGGSTWTTAPAVSATSSLLLASDAASTRVYFRPNTNFNGTLTNAFTFRAWDRTSGTSGSTANTSTNGGQTAFSSATDTAGITITAVNDAPVATGSATLAAVNEDTTNPPGATVSTLFSGNFSDATDAVVGGSSANAFAGIAVTGYTRDAAKGEWQFSTDGTTWSNISSVAGNASALTFRVSDSLRFLPASNFNGPAPTLTVRLIESPASLTPNGTLDVSNNGTTTNISASTVVLSASVTAVNDAPVASGSASLTAVNEDSTNPPGATVSTLFTGNFNDSVDTVTGGSSANTLAGIAITGYTRDAAKGEWQYSTNGTSWTNIGSSITGDSAALTFPSANFLRFLPATNFNGPAPTLTVRLIESPTAVATAATLNVSSNGGSTTISGSTVVLSTSITAVNDAPVASGSASLTAVNEDSTNPPGATVSTLFTGNFNDSVDAVTGGSSANTLAGIAITGYTRDASKGEWQYSTNGTSWTNIGSSITGDSAALTFKSADFLRFLPALNFNGPAPTLTVRLIESPTAVATAATLNVSSNGGSTTISGSTVVLSTSITAVNDAPVASGSAALTAVNEDSTNPSGATVSTLFTGNFNDSVDAVTGGSSANTLAGIAITGYARDAAKGEWQYSTNGTSWTDIASSITGDSAALTFPSANFLRFLPATNFNGPAPTLTVRLIESPTAVSTATTLNVSSNGGSTSISGSTVVLSTSITAVNDAPVASGTASLTAVNEDSTSPSGATVATLFGDNFSDSADQVTGGSSANTLAGIAITSYTRDAVKGEWQYSTNGTTWTSISSSITGDSAALTFKSADFLRFLPAANFNGAAPTLTVRLIESPTVVTTNATVNVSSHGGTTAISLGTVVLSTSITAVNDAPQVFLGGLDGNGAGIKNVLIKFSENDGAVAVAPSALLSDIDSTQLQRLTITLTNAQDGAAEVLAANAGTTGLLVSSFSGGVLTISGAGSIADYQTVLRSVTYNNTSENPNTSVIRAITFVARDNQGADSLDGPAATASVTLGSVNNAPTYNTGLIDRSVTNKLPFSFSYPINAFTDPEGDALTLSAQQVVNGTASALPSWITFNPSTRKFYGVVPEGVSSLVVRVTATDPSGATGTRDFTITATPTLGTQNIAAVSFATAYNLINAPTHSTSDYYQLETSSFTTASAPMPGTNFVFYQADGVVLENGTYKFEGNNVPGKLTYINTAGDVVTLPSNGLGIVSRPIKTQSNTVQGYYMWIDNGTASITDDTAVLLVVNPNYFAPNTQYNSSSDQVDTNLNGYLTSVGFSVANASGLEGNGTAGTANANAIRFVVTRSSSTPTARASVSYSTSIVSGLNTASTNDFVSTSGTVSFEPGVLTATISIASVNDAVFENDETFTLTLSNPTVFDGQTVQGRLDNATAIGTIVNDDSTSFSIAPSGGEEGTPPGAGNPIAFTVTRIGSSAVSQSVTYSTELKGTGNGFANGDDFTSTTGVLTFGPGETTKTFTVTTVPDEIVEPDEVFTAKLSGATGGATISQATADGTIEDDENTSIYSIAAASATEGTGITFTITRSKKVQGTQTISFYTGIADGDTATSGNASSGDFVGIATGTGPVVEFGPDDLTKTITIATNADNWYEADETFTVHLESLQVIPGVSTKISSFNGKTKGTILNNDTTNPLPIFTVAVHPDDAAGVTESVVGTTRSIRFIVTRSALSQETQTIDYATIILASDTASDLDFVPASGTLSFPNSGTNSLTQTVTVQLRDDSVAEPTETFGFAISNPSISALSLGTPSVATGTILDSNRAPAAGGVVTAIEDTPYVFSDFDFYSDPEEAGLSDIEILSLPSPSQGKLQIATTRDANGVVTSWADVSVGLIQVAGLGGIGDGGFRFEPAENYNTAISPVPTFTLKVKDGNAWSSTGTVTINITPVNDAPEGNSLTPSLSAYVGGFISLQESMFGFNDPNDNPSDDFHAVKFTNVPDRPVQGQTVNQGALQTQVSDVSTSRSGTLANARDIRTSAFSQSTTPGNPQFVFAVQGNFQVDVEGVTTSFDRQLRGRYGMMYLNSTNGNYYFQQYTGGATGYQFVSRYDGASAPYTEVRNDLVIPAGVKVSDGFLFDVGQNGNDFFRRTLTITLTGNGSGFDFESTIWKTVEDGDFVSKETITAGKVRYSPCFCGVARYSRDGNFQLAASPGVFTTLEYQVQDDGGTALGGVDLDPTPNKIDITLIDGFTSVVNVPREIYFNEDTTVSFNGFGPSSVENQLFVTYNPPGVAVEDINDITVVVDLDPLSRPGTLSLDGGVPVGVIATTIGGRTMKYEIVGSTTFVNSVLANLSFTPDADKFSTIDNGVNADPRYPGLNGIGDTDTYAILRISAKNNPKAGQIQYPTNLVSTDLSVLNVNDAPIASGSAQLPDVDEDASAPTGALVSALFAANFSDETDSYPNYDLNHPTKQTLAGVAVTSYVPDAARGSWQFSETGAAGSWTNLTSRTPSGLAYVLPASYRLRFVPAANHNGAIPSLTVKLIETAATSLIAGERDVASVGTFGGTTAVSTGTVVLSGVVVAINDAPVATGNSALDPVTEDTGVAAPGQLVSALFGPRFNDDADQVAGGSSSNSLAGIAITAYTAAASKGRWEYNNGSGWATLISVSGASSATILPANSQLRFVPAGNFNGPAPTLTAVLIDNSMGTVSFATGINLGTTGGTSQYSSASVILSHSVVAVNDAPVATGSATLASILEDTASPPGATVANLFNLNFNDTADNVVGGSSANILAGVAVRNYTENTSKGVWEYSTDSGSSWTTLGSVSGDDAALVLKRTDMLRFRPAANFNSTSVVPNSSVPPVVVRLIDSSFPGNLTTGQTLDVGINGATTPYSLSVVTLTTTVTGVNDRPVSANQSVAVLEDTSYTFTSANFGAGTGYSDADDNPSNNFVKVKITGLPASGSLRLSGQIVSVGDTISLRDIIDGKLTYTPAPNVHGAGVAEVLFKVQDDGGVANAPVGSQDIDTSAIHYTVTINVTSVNDAPASSGFAVTSNEDEEYTFSRTNFPFSDASDSPANAFQSVIITSLPAFGTLRLSGVDVTVGQVIPVSELANLKFTPTTNTNGLDYARIGFRVQDNGGTADGGVDTSVPAYTITINITPVNDQPVATGNATLPDAFKNGPNTSGVTVAELFGPYYSDPNDLPAPNSMTGIAITGLTPDPASGVWEYYDPALGQWRGMDSIGPANSLTLRSTDRIRFMPTEDYVGPAPEITVRLIENVSPTTGDRIDLSGVLSPTGNYSSNEVTLNHSIRGGLLVKGLPDISEGTDAVFIVSFDQETTTDVLLTLSNNGSTESDDYVSTWNETNAWISTPPRVNVYYFDGSNLVVLPVSAGGVVSVPGLSKFYVSVPTTDDAIYEGPESLRLTASMTGSTSSDIATILDEGSGVEYKTDGTPKLSYTPDNDLSVDVLAYTPVNEASDHAFFKVTGSTGDRLRLAINAQATNLGAARIEYTTATSTTTSSDWTSYDGALNIPTVPASAVPGVGVIYVRVSIVSEQDDIFEGAENFSLVATSKVNASVSDSDTTTIVDNGTGKKFGPELDNGAPEESENDLDDDRGLSVTSYGPVNENSPYHMFKVTAPAGLPLNLQLEGPASGNAANFAAMTFEYWNGSLWVPYTWNGVSGNRPTVPSGGTTGDVLVRVNISAIGAEVDDPTSPASSWFEGSETFRLKATTPSGKFARAIGEVIDNGTGGLYNGSWGSDAPVTFTGRLDDDRIWPENDFLDSAVLSTVTVNALANDVSIPGVTISGEIDLDPSTPTVFDSVVVVPGEGTWRVVNGQVTYSMLSTYRADPTPRPYAIRAADRSNLTYSNKTALIDIDFPVGTVADGNNPVGVLPGSTVIIPVLDNDTFGDVPVGATLRFNGRASGDRSDLVIPSEGTWSILAPTDIGNSSGAWAVRFTPASGFLGDPTPQRYVVEDIDGNLSPATLVTVTYERPSRFVVQINDGYQANPLGFDVVIVDNMPAGATVDIGGVIIVTTQADTNMTVGRIVWSRTTASANLLPNFSRVQVDARSKPVLSGSFADISLTATVASSLTASGANANIEIRASDMTYSYTPGNYSLVSPLGGSNNGKVWFSETVGLINQPFVGVADPAALASDTISNQSPSTGFSGTRSVNWSGTTNFTTTRGQLSLAKSLKIEHGRGSLTTQMTVGGKILEEGTAPDLRPYIDWVLPPGIDASAASILSQAVDRPVLFGSADSNSALRGLQDGNHNSETNFVQIVDKTKLPYLEWKPEGLDMEFEQVNPSLQDDILAKRLRKRK